jgi:hypothetical protein
MNENPIDLRLFDHKYVDKYPLGISRCMSDYSHGGNHNACALLILEGKNLSRYRCRGLFGRKLGGCSGKDSEESR